MSRAKQLARAVDKALAKRDKQAKVDEAKSKLADDLAALKEIIAARTAKAAEAIQPAPAPTPAAPPAPAPQPSPREQWQAARREGRALEAARLMSLHGDRILADVASTKAAQPSTAETARATERDTAQATAGARHLAEYEAHKRAGRNALAANVLAEHRNAIEAARRGQS